MTNVNGMFLWTAFEEQNKFKCFDYVKKAYYNKRYFPPIKIQVLLMNGKQKQQKQTTIRLNTKLPKKVY